jgi:hypothetical protein
MSDATPPGFSSTPPPPPLPPRGDGRTGPPWERGGELVNRFVETARAVVTDAKGLFAGMRREGGLGAPLLYAVIGMVVGAVFTYVWSFLGVREWMAGRYGGGGGIAGIILAPVFGTIGLFIGSGIFHVMLMLLGEAKFPFETSFRVAAYTVGTTSLFNVVPFCGGIVGGLFGLYLLIVGLSEAHEIPVGKSAIAVLVPVVVCCAVVALVTLVFGIALGALFGLASR